MHRRLNIANENAQGVLENMSFTSEILTIHQLGAHSMMVGKQNFLLLYGEQTPAGCAISL